MQLITPPKPIRAAWGSLAAWWLAYIINPGFHAVAVMLLLMIPILLLDRYIAPAKTQPLTNETDDENGDTIQENSA